MSTNRRFVERLSWVGLPLVIEDTCGETAKIWYIDEDSRALDHLLSGPK